MASKHPKTNRLLCYPMVGPVEKQYSTLLNILHAIRTDTHAQSNFIQWLQTSFHISNSFARKVCTILFFGMGFVQRKKKRYELSEIGRKVLSTKDPDLFYTVFSKAFFAVDTILQILGKIQPARWDDLQDKWSSHIRSVRTEPSSWSKRHLNSQLRFRVDWLRSLGLVDFITGTYYVSRKGSQIRRLDLESTAATRTEKEQIVHNDLEDKLTLIGAFFQFNVKKRATLNDILPTSSQLKENRQVDALWVRFVHFGGKLQYPFEVQLSGSMADAIERLEMVANIVQKAVVITDGKQKEKMLDRLRVKRSPLLDKIVFLEPAEVDKILEATIIMKSFTEALFGE
jgi:hypothetical protein